MRLVPDRPNVELRRDGAGEQIVVLAFPYDRALVDSVRAIPRRRFDWDTREWSAPPSDWAGMKVAELLERFPDLTPSRRCASGWRASDSAGSAACSTRALRRPRLVRARHLGRPAARGAARAARSSAAGGCWLPLTPEAAQALREQQSARLDIGAERCLPMRRRPARCRRPRGSSGSRRSTASSCGSTSSGIPTSARRSRSCPPPRARRSVPLDP